MKNYYYYYETGERQKKLIFLKEGPALLALYFHMVLHSPLPLPCRLPLLSERQCAGGSWETYVFTNQLLAGRWGQTGSTSHRVYCMRQEVS